jgi:hypothetical protein
MLSFANFTPGAVQVTRFPVPYNAGARLSEDWLWQQVQHAHQARNCGADGCTTVYVNVLDPNTGLFVRLQHVEPPEVGQQTGRNGFQVLSSNWSQ